MKKKDWKKFEEIVAELEQKISGETAIVKSPDVLYDKDTGSPIKVDGTIRTKVGSADFLVVLECRDRGRKSEVAWIRELKTRKEDTQAHGLIAISSTGVSSEATRKARAHGIIIRKLDRLTADQLIGTRFNLEVVNYYTESFSFSFHETLNDSGLVFKQEFLDSGEISATQKICGTPNSNEQFTPLEIFDSWIKQPNSDLDAIQFDENGLSLPLKMEASYDLGALFIPSSKGNLMVKVMSVDFRLTTVPSVSLNAVSRSLYSDENSKPLYETYQFADDRSSVSLEINHIKSTRIEKGKVKILAIQDMGNKIVSIGEFTLKIKYKSKTDH